ncbi:hypothetical protein, partial [Staphylococcus haemolyticus]|uniref:hypothetical protein n=1 Tax=Staphylococcus haemolyticus TaxID=1283 RepID=UPI001C93097B
FNTHHHYLFITTSQPLFTPTHSQFQPLIQSNPLNILQSYLHPFNHPVPLIPIPQYFQPINHFIHQFQQQPPL